jgi:hypothetical protein
MAAHAENPRLGPRVAAEIIIYRGFPDRGFRKRKNQPPHKAEHFAYLLREEDVQNGLSLGATPWDAVRHFAGGNFGYCSIRVGDIDSLGLEVRIDTTDAAHLFICNLPYQRVSNEARDEATRLAKALARASFDVVCDPYVPN